MTRNYHRADLASYGELFDNKFINAGCVVFLENVNLCYHELPHTLIILIL